LEIANGGTLFLDELTEMSLPLQAKLLRVLQDGVVRRVGSEKEDAVVDVRFISATNRNPQDCVAKGTLREDLMYRLRVVPIHLPPLRKRQEDIPLLANHFLTHFWERHRGSSEAPPKISDSAIEFLRSRPWRGNVRELQNVIEQLTVLAESGQVVQPEDVPVYDDTLAEAPTSGLPSNVLANSFHVAKDKLIAQFEKEYLSQLIARAGSNMSKAARLANIDRTTLYRLMDKHGFRREEMMGTFDE
jgi:transcriptional regulator with PAS, ATPase and Fis domain